MTISGNENYKCETKIEYLRELAESFSNKSDEFETPYINIRICTICGKKAVGMVQMDLHFQEFHLKNGMVI